jgi:ribosomal protein L7/L12
MSNEQIIHALYGTGLVETDNAFGIVIAKLKLQLDAKKYWPYIVANRRKEKGLFDGKLDAVKAIKSASGLGLKESKDIADILWFKDAPAYIEFQGEILPYLADLHLLLENSSHNYTLLDSNEQVM